MVDTAGGWGNPINKKAQSNQEKIDFSSINKDNIFSSDILSQLITKPVNNVPNKVEDTKANKENTQDPGISSEKTEQFTNYLSSLGFSLGAQPIMMAQQNTKSEEPEKLQIMARSREGIYLVNDDENNYFNDQSKLICEAGNASVFSSNGIMLAYSNAKGVGIYNFLLNKRLTYDMPNVIAMHFSQTDKYFVTIDKRENPNNPKESKFFITVFESTTMKKVLDYETMKYKKEQWPHMKFTEDDKYVFRTRKPTAIEILSPEKKFQVIKTIETQPFDYFVISVKLENLLIATAKLEQSAGYDKHEGRIDIYKFDNLEKPMVTTTIEHAHEVNFFFSPTGQNLLIWAQTFTDKTGKSYYGEHILLYLDMNKKTLKKVPTYKGPIHDVAWNPNGMEFIVISGFMPAGSVLFDNFCTPKFEFGKHHRNTIEWSPLSRFVCLAGFGNLSGDMEIWDAITLKQLGTCKANSAVSCQWAPDGRRLMTGVLNPRLRVDNGYKIFKYTGKQFTSVDFSHSELYEVLWRPGKFWDRPASPLKTQTTSTGDKEKEKEGDPEKKEKKLFRPVGGGSFAAQLKAEKAGTTGPRFLDPNETFGSQEPEKQEEENKPKEELIPRKKITRKGDKKGEGGGSESSDNSTTTQ